MTAATKNTKKLKVVHLDNKLDVRSVSNSALVRLLVQIKHHPKILDQVPANQHYARQLVSKHVRQNYLALEHPCWLTLSYIGRWFPVHLARILCCQTLGVLFIVPLKFQMFQETCWKASGAEQDIDCCALPWQGSTRQSPQTSKCPQIYSFLSQLPWAGSSLKKWIPAGSRPLCCIQA